MSNLFQIYGISGEKKHGKDTYGKLIKELNPQFTIMHFAKDLKDMSGAIFGLTEYQMYDDDGKEALLTRPCNMDDFVAEMSEATGLQIQSKGLVAESARQILQYFGTEYVRSVKDSYWIDRVLRKIKEVGNHIVIPDTRFANEYEAVRKVGGQIIKVTRVGLEQNKNSAHASEAEQRALVADYNFSFREGELPKMREAAYLVARNTLQQAGHLFDPGKALAKFLHTFNVEFEKWSDAFGWGVNIVPRYRDDGSGKKYFEIFDLSPLPKGPPAPHRVKAAGAAIDAALQATLQHAGKDTRPPMAKGVEYPIEKEIAPVPCGVCDEHHDAHVVTPEHHHPEGDHL